MGASTIEATITSSSDFGRQKWNRMILGHFIEHFHRQIYGGLYEPGSPLSDDNGFRKDVIAAMKQLGTPIMRWPGGNYVSDHHWYEAVGPERVPTYNKAWRVVEPNTFGTDEFMSWCAEVGCEPYLCTNAGNGTPEEMSNWVEYCNGRLDTKHARWRRRNGHDAPYGVKYWGIGNESYGDWQIGAKRVFEWGPYVAESAKMMRAVDEGIVLSAAAVPDTEWTLALLREAGRYLDLVSIHGYWDPIHQKDDPADFLTAMTAVTNPEMLIRRTRSVIDAAGFTGRIGIAFDEWNLRGWHHPDGNAPEKIAARDRNDLHETYTMADALFSASFINACLRNADIVTMANVSPSVNARGPIYVDHEGLVKRTSFHALKMYNDHLLEDILATSIRSARLAQDRVTPAVDAVVSRDAKHTAVFIVNRHAEASADCRLRLDGELLEGAVEVVTLDGDSPDAYNSPQNPDAVVPRSERTSVKDGRFTVPPHALVVLKTV